MHNIVNVLKQISFLLVFCAMLLQPIAKTFSLFSDTSIELADFDDDTEEEVEDITEEDTKIEPQFISATVTYYNFNNCNATDYLQLSRSSCNLEIVIPPPRHA